MTIQHFSVRSLIALIFTVFAISATVLAQGSSMSNFGTNFQICAGYIQSESIDTTKKLVGANDEKEKNNFSQGNFVYINAGSSSGVKVGDMFSVVRPRGRVESRWSKKANLGFFVQEVGAVEVIRVRNDVAIAEVQTSCDNLLMGDLIQPMPDRTKINTDDRPAFDIFALPSGKTMGNIIMSRDGAELLTSNNIVYVDLGADDNIKVGDFLTIFRPLGTGNILDDLPGESVSARDGGFESREYAGGKFSNQAARKSGGEARGTVITSKNAKKDRPSDLRKIVGEMVVITVKGKTATAVITRTSGEIHTGDKVEMQ